MHIIHTYNICIQYQTSIDNMTLFSFLYPLFSLSLPLLLGFGHLPSTLQEQGRWPLPATTSFRTNPASLQAHSRSRRSMCSLIKYASVSRSVVFHGLCVCGAVCVCVCADLFPAVMILSTRMLSGGVLVECVYFTTDNMDDR